MFVISILQVRFISDIIWYKKLFNRLINPIRYTHIKLSSIRYEDDLVIQGIGISYRCLARLIAQEPV